MMSENNQELQQDQKLQNVPSQKHQKQLESKFVIVQHELSNKIEKAKEELIQKLTQMKQELLMRDEKIIAISQQLKNEMDRTYSDLWRENSSTKQQSPRSEKLLSKKRTYRIEDFGQQSNLKFLLLLFYGIVLLSLSFYFFTQMYHNMIPSETKKNQMVQIFEHNPEDLVNKTTPFYDSFRVYQNTIRLRENTPGDGRGQITLQTVIDRTDAFTFHIHIHEFQRSNLCVGVVDRVMLKGNRFWCQSGDAICYCQQEHSHRGEIYYGKGIYGQWEKISNREPLQKGMDIQVTINGMNNSANFTLKRGHQMPHEDKAEMKGTIIEELQSEILSQPRRQFVPFLAMKSGNSISWTIPTV